MEQLQHMNLNIEDKIQYVMMDASDAEYNALQFRTVFPKAIILMCWFHVMKCIKKHLVDCNVPAELQEMFKTEINDMHCCLSFEAFRYKLDHVKIKWGGYAAFLLELIFCLFHEGVVLS